MRYQELFEFKSTPHNLGTYDPAKDYFKTYAKSTDKPKLTLAVINKLKRIKKLHQAGLAKRLAFIPEMYGDGEQQVDEDTLADERQKLENEKLMLAVEKSIQDAEVSSDQKDAIQKMALDYINDTQK